MKFIFKTISLILIFLVSLLILLPKEGLYNLVEKEFSKHNIIISNEIRESKLFGINIKGAEVYYEGINTTFIKNIDLNTYLFYTNINIDTIRVSKSLVNILPEKIKILNLKHSIFNFEKVYIDAIGEFGEFEAEILLLDRKIVGVLKPSKMMKSKYKNILKQFKLIEGEYHYEFRF